MFDIKKNSSYNIFNKLNGENKHPVKGLSVLLLGFSFFYLFYTSQRRIVDEVLLMNHILDDLSPMWVTLKTALTATVITFVLGVFAAHWITTCRGKGKSLIDGLLILPMVLPPTVIGFILLLIFGKNGPIGQILCKIGINVIFSWPATVIAAIVVSFPLMYKTTSAAFELVDKNILDAARTLGASEWRIFFKVTFPLSWQGILAGIILSFARAMGEFGATLMIAGSIPGRTQTIPVEIFFAVESGEIQKAFAWVSVMSSISLFLIISLHYWSNKRQAYFRR